MLVKFPRQFVSSENYDHPKYRKLILFLKEFQQKNCNETIFIPGMFA